MFANIGGVLLATNFFEGLNKENEKSFEELIKYIENSDSLCETIILTSLVFEMMLCIISMIIGIVAGWDMISLAIFWLLIILATCGVGLLGAVVYELIEKYSNKHKN